MLVLEELYRAARFGVASPVVAHDAGGVIEPLAQFVKRPRHLGQEMVDYPL
jgi:hypothetical protein